MAKGGKIALFSLLFLRTQAIILPRPPPFSQTISFLFFRPKFLTFTIGPRKGGSHHVQVSFFFLFSLRRQSSFPLPLKGNEPFSLFFFSGNILEIDRRVPLSVSHLRARRKRGKKSIFVLFLFCLRSCQMTVGRMGEKVSEQFPIPLFLLSFFFALSIKINATDQKNISPVVFLAK